MALRVTCLDLTMAEEFVGNGIFLERVFHSDCQHSPLLQKQLCHVCLLQARAALFHIATCQIGIPISSNIQSVTRISIALTYPSLFHHNQIVTTLHDSPHHPAIAEQQYLFKSKMPGERSRRTTWSDIMDEDEPLPESPHSPLTEEYDQMGDEREQENNY
jgi:hypothetical protein